MVQGSTLTINPVGSALPRARAFPRAHTEASPHAARPSFLSSHSEILFVSLSGLELPPHASRLRSVSFGQSMCFSCCAGHSVTRSSIQLTFLAASLGQALVGVLLSSQVFNTSLQLGRWMQL